MNYSILILRRAQSELTALPVDAYEKGKSAISALAENRRPRGCQKLTGREGWRIRVGVYRVIYEIDDSEKLATVLPVGHRRNAYR